ncbi:MAG: ORF6N domain-containing protein [Verrucomicrobiota bacterium]
MPKDTLAIQAEQRILILREQKVMLDLHLAELYGVETRTHKQAVRRNPERFPDDFMFELTAEEVSNLRSQTVIPSSHGGSRYGNLAFTEQGVAMLSSVLRSTRAVEVNIAIMRAFVRLRQMLATHKELAAKLEEMEKKYDGQFRLVFDAIRQLMAPTAKPKGEVGFHAIPNPAKKKKP